MAFGDIYCTILLPFVESYKHATNQKNRAVVIKNAAEAVVNSRHLLEDTGIDLPKDLNTVCPLSFSICLQYYSWCQAITRYIKGLTEKESTVKGGDPKPTKVKQVYSLRDVIKQHHRGLVEAEIPYKPTDKEYIGSYQRAVTTVLKNMSEKEVEEAEEIVDSWNKEGAPAEVQLKWVGIIL